ncbi:MAG: hypothetical protein RLZZ175_1460 [Bacteroidota bacterium]|jgi:hypothetical protein
MTSGKYYFLSRPRRFGKSLLLSTLKEIYSGSKELFAGFWIENNWDWTKKHPVIHVKFASMSYETKGLSTALYNQLQAIGKDLKIELLNTDLKDAFQELIHKTVELYGKKVVILVDEYDKPVIDYLDNLEVAYQNRAILKQFYSVLKDNDQNVEFLLITGVGKFTKVSIFSDLNNLRDITIDTQYSTLVGITQNELDNTFAEEIEKYSSEYEDIKAELKRFYNGYSWGGKETVYNPFSLLSFMQTGEFKIYWFQTGTPTFLIDEVKRRDQFNFEEVEADLDGLSDLNFENLNSSALLFQTGYLTITDYDKETGIYTLKYPNKEVKDSLNRYLLVAYRYVEQGTSTPLVVKLLKAFRANEINEVVSVINTAFSTIPYDLWRNATELHYHALTHLTFTLLGSFIESEVHSANGRCDMIVKTKTHIYALEFKLDESAEVALNQIQEKGYLTPFALDERIKVAIGISFSSEKKAIAAYLVR